MNEDHHIRKYTTLRKIFRQPNAPYFLSTQRVVSEKVRLLEYLRLPLVSRRQRRDNVDRDLFFDSGFRREVAKAFQDKCAFCESAVSGEGQIVHLRPLRISDESTHDSAQGYGERGYYLWLAFEWKNIFFACDACFNYKADRFPVRGERASYLATFHDVVREESSLIIDPTSEDPSKYLSLLADGRLKPLSPLGGATIDLFLLNRRALVAERKSQASQLIADVLAFSYGGILNTLAPQAAFSGSLNTLFRRIAQAWSPNGNPITGSGRALIDHFHDARARATDQQIGRLHDLLNEIREADGNEVVEESAFQNFSVQERAAVSAGKKPESLPGALSVVSISNYKAIEGLTLSLSANRSSRAGAPSLMILGENSTGKSSALSAIALALIGAKEASKLKSYFPDIVRSSSIDRFDKLDDDVVDVSVRFHFSDRICHFRYDPGNETIDGMTEPACIVLGYGPRRFFDPKRRSKKATASSKVQSLFNPLATIPYPNDWLRAQTGRRFDSISAALKIVLSLEENDELLVRPDHLAVRTNGRVSPIDTLSEGYRSVFVMTVDIIRELLGHWDDLEKAEAVVLIDEIETHLHPRWKMQVMTSLRRVLPRVQFIATTHDPLCLRGMDDGEVAVLRRNESDQIEQIKDLPSVSGMTSEQLLLSDYFGLSSTTDPRTEISLAKIAGDVAIDRGDGRIDIELAQDTIDLVERITVGNSQSEQIIQEALARYLRGREDRDGRPRATLRLEAVEAVVKALQRMGS
ncbi:AAA family ATPase [Pseudoxanthomonas sacheonensis]|uniref:AAA+ ATPase domain-containing protein n=1 Tax=Pseudoxanthomonas sacheonensis TaxID=443615 RepID=A0ABU1RUG4_9GAMM|nr:AAA family ATPase [Pseudoxanthomonas sacheonensis]MDR6842411.1 hypothetical protein [Pseudoxanthomonas sacheonensis]